MPYAEEAFRSLGDVVVLPPGSITREQTRDADLLCIRSTTRVDRALLEGSSVRFVGTATIGTDHMDLEYLEQAGIAWRSAAGCNANSVSEYVTAALLCLARRHQFTLEGKTIGVIGVGHVGSLVVKKAEALGLRTLQNDPPRREAQGREIAERGGQKTEFVSLQHVLKHADIITLHAPLTRTGRHSTFHLADAKFFQRLKPGCVFLNTARGPVADSDALIGAMDRGIVAHAVLDTWEGEPAFRNDVLSRMDLGTPHIAGHSFDGKVMGTVMVFREACRFLGVAPTWTPDALLPKPVVPEINRNAAGRDEEAVLWELVREVYDIEADDRRMRQAATDDEKQRREMFEQLRQNYPVRREFRFTLVNLRNSRPHLKKKVGALGFSVA